MFILLKNKSLNINTRVVQSSTIQKHAYCDDTRYFKGLFFHSYFVRSVIRRAIMLGNDIVVNTFEWFDCNGEYTRKNGPSQLFNGNELLKPYIRLAWYEHGKLKCVRVF
jgi:hypothetical protein